jgi:hypothetical protein
MSPCAYACGLGASALVDRIINSRRVTPSVRYFCWLPLEGEELGKSLRFTQ